MFLGAPWRARLRLLQLAVEEALARREAAGLDAGAGAEATTICGWLALAARGLPSLAAREAQEVGDDSDDSDSEDDSDGEAAASASGGPEPPDPATEALVCAAELVALAAALRPRCTAAAGWHSHRR